MAPNGFASRILLGLTSSNDDLHQHILGTDFGGQFHLARHEGNGNGGKRSVMGHQVKPNCKLHSD